MKGKDFNPDNNTMLVWRFYDAPKELRALSDNGGDEDWLVLVPPNVWKSNFWYPPRWVENMDSGYEPQEIKLDDDYVVFIGAHS